MSARRAAVAAAVASAEAAAVAAGTVLPHHHQPPAPALAVPTTTVSPPATSGASSSPGGPEEPRVAAGLGHSSPGLPTTNGGPGSPPGGQQSSAGQTTLPSVPVPHPGDFHPAYRIPGYMEHLYSLQHASASLHGKSQSLGCLLIQFLAFAKCRCFDYMVVN